MYSGNRASNGFALSSWSEFVGHGSFGKEPIDDVDLEVLRWDECYRTFLPDEFRKLIAEQYCMPKLARKEQGKKSGSYYDRRRYVEECCIVLFKSFNERISRA